MFNLHIAYDASKSVFSKLSERKDFAGRPISLILRLEETQDHLDITPPDVLNMFQDMPNLDTICLHQKLTRKPDQYPVANLLNFLAHPVPLDPEPETRTVCPYGGLSMLGIGQSRDSFADHLIKTMSHCNTPSEGQHPRSIRVVLGHDAAMDDESYQTMEAAIGTDRLHWCDRVGCKFPCMPVGWCA